MLTVFDGAGLPVTLTGATPAGSYTVKVTGLGGAQGAGYLIAASGNRDGALTINPAPANTVPGDLNGDGKVDIADALLALRIAVGIYTASAAQLTAGDVTPFVLGKPAPDGIIDVGDALLILRVAVGLISF